MEFIHRFSLFILLSSLASAAVQAAGYLPAIQYVLSKDDARQRIDSVFFAQTHVLQPQDDYFGLVADREALIKVQVVSSAEEDSPAVTALISLGSMGQEINLSGPPKLPRSFNSSKGRVVHEFSNSFTATIPKEWIKPGLNVSVRTPNDELLIGEVKVGAPTEVKMTMLDVHFFNFSSGNYADGWEQELEAKWPVAKLSLERAPFVVFNELVIPTREGKPPVKVDSTQDYFDQTGINFDGEQGAAAQWNRALKRAAGLNGRISLFYTNIYGVPSGGQAGGFAGVGNGRSLGILHHELGHALSLPHWGNNSQYPYKGDMHGVSAPNSFKGTHAGPTWAYDPQGKTFIPATIQANSVAGNSTPRGTYKQDPMQGGGTGDQENGFLFRHFSDYSVNQMRNYLEGHVVVWNPDLASYALWDSDAGAYSRAVTNNGVQYPLTRDASVISVMASVSGSVSGVNMVYPPIGPYKSGLINLFNPSNAADRQAAAQTFCPNDGCDVTFRVTQGDDTTDYMLAVAWQTGLALTDQNALNTTAINLPYSDQDVTSVELLLTPDAQINGLPQNPQVIASWSAVP